MDMEWLHLAGDIGASIAILVCLYFIWDLRKEVETLQDRLSGGSLPELDTLISGPPTRCQAVYRCF